MVSKFIIKGIFLLFSFLKCLLLSPVRSDPTTATNEEVKTFTISNVPCQPGQCDLNEDKATFNNIAFALCQIERRGNNEKIELVLLREVNEINFSLLNQIENCGSSEKPKTFFRDSHARNISLLIRPIDPLPISKIIMEENSMSFLVPISLRFERVHFVIQGSTNVRSSENASTPALGSFFEFNFCSLPSNLEIGSSSFINFSLTRFVYFLYTVDNTLIIENSNFNSVFFRDGFLLTESPDSLPDHYRYNYKIVLRNLTFDVEGHESETTTSPFFQIFNSGLYIDNIQFKEWKLPLLIADNSNISFYNSHFTKIRISKIVTFLARANTSLQIINITIDTLENLLEDFFPEENTQNTSYSFFYIDYLNNISFSNFTIKNLSYDFGGEINTMSLFLFNRKNSVRFEGLHLNRSLIILTKVFSLFHFDKGNYVTFLNCQFFEINLRASMYQDDITKNVMKVRTLLNQSVFNQTEALKAYFVFSVINLVLENTINITNSSITKIFTLTGFLICFASNTIIIVNSTFSNVSAEIIGGVISIWFKNTLIVDGCSTQYSTAIRGGFLFSATTNNITFKYNEFQNMKTFTKVKYESLVSSGGIACLIYNNTMIFKMNHVESTSSDFMGGVFVLETSNNLSLSDLIIKETRSYILGGMCYCEKNNNLKLSNVTIYSAFIEEDGGVLYLLERNTIEMENFFIDKSDSTRGGIVYAARNNWIGCKRIISNFSWLEFGGFAFLNENNVIQITNSIIIGNEVLLGGGAIYAQKLNDICIQNSNINYMSTKEGGVLYLSFNNYVEISGVGVSAAYSHGHGGMIYAVNNNIITMNSSSIGNNTSENTGGFSYFDCLNQLTLNNVSFQSNFAREYGGLIIMCDHNKISINSSSFTNFQQLSGSGIFLYSRSFNNISLENSHILIEFVGFGYEISISSCSFFDLTALNNSLSFLKCFIEDKSNNKSSTQDRLFIHSLMGSIIKVNESTINLTKEIKSFMKLELSQATVSKSVFKNCYLESLFVLVDSKLRLDRSIFYNCTHVSMLVHLVQNSSLDAHLSRFKQLNSKSILVLSFSSNITLDLVFVSFCMPRYNQHLHNEFNSKIILFNRSSIYTKRIVFLCANTSSFSGALYFYQAGNITIRESEFKYNQAINGFGGAFTIIDSDIVDMRNNSFFFNTARFGGSIALFDVKNFSLSRCRFLSNKAYNSNNLKELNLYYYQNLQPSNGIPKIICLALTSGTFLSKGGCIYLSNNFSDSTINLTFNNFKTCNAEAGAVLFTENFRLSDSNFTISNTLVRNKAFKYGETMASNIAFVKIGGAKDKFPLNPNETFVLEEPLILKNQNNDCYFYIFAYDIYENLVLGDQSLLATTLFTITTVYESTTQKISITFTNKNGLKCASSINDTVVRSLPLAKLLNLNFSVPFYSAKNRIDNATFSVQVTYRNCDIGEKFDENLWICVPCQQGFFSFNTNITLESTCITCTDKPFFCYGGKNLTPIPGYWRFTENSQNFLRCPLEAACIGDILGDTDEPGAFINKVPTGLCATGYTGILCSQCEENYGRGEKYSCSKCDDIGENLMAIFRLLLKLCIFGYSFWKAVRLTQILKQMDLNPEKARASFNSAATNSLIKIFFDHCFILISLFFFPFSRSPIQIKTYMKYEEKKISIESTDIFSYKFNEYSAYALNLFSPDINGYTSLECIKLSLGIGMDYFYFKQLLVLLFPFFSAFFFVGFTFVDRWYRNRRFSMSSSEFPQRRQGFAMSRIMMKEEDIIRRIVYSVKNKPSIEAVFLVVFMISSVEIIQSMFQSLFYVNVGYNDNKEHRLLSDPTIKWDSPSHIKWMFFFSVPVLVIFAGFFPIYIMYRLRTLQKLKKLSSMSGYSDALYLKNEEKISNYLFRYGYFFYPYKERFFYFDLVYFARRYIFSIFTVFITPLLRIHIKYNPTTFLIMATLLLFCFLVIHTNTKPFKKEIKSINLLQSYSYTALVASYSFASLILGDYMDEVMDPLLSYRGIRSFPFWISVTLFVLTLIPNVVFFILAFALFLKYESRNIRNIWAKFKIIIASLKRRLNILKGHNKAEKPRQKKKLTKERLNPLEELKVENERLLKEISTLKEDNHNMSLLLSKKTEECQLLEDALNKKALFSKILLKERKEIFQKTEAKQEFNDEEGKISVANLLKFSVKHPESRNRERGSAEKAPEGIDQELLSDQKGRKPLEITMNQNLVVIERKEYFLEVEFELSNKLDTDIDEIRVLKDVKASPNIFIWMNSISKKAFRIEKRSALKLIVYSRLLNPFLKPVCTLDISFKVKYEKTNEETINEQFCFNMSQFLQVCSTTSQLYSRPSYKSEEKKLEAVAEAEAQAGKEKMSDDKVRGKPGSNFLEVKFNLQPENSKINEEKSMLVHKFERGHCHSSIMAVAEKIQTIFPFIPLIGRKSSEDMEASCDQRASKTNTLEQLKPQTLEREEFNKAQGDKLSKAQGEKIREKLLIGSCYVNFVVFEEYFVLALIISNATISFEIKRANNKLGFKHMDMSKLLFLQNTILEKFSFIF